MDEKDLLKILQMLHKKKFAEWYERGNFDAFISGDLHYNLGCTREMAQKVVLEDLKEMLE